MLITNVSLSPPLSLFLQVHEILIPSGMWEDEAIQPHWATERYWREQKRGSPILLRKLRGHLPATDASPSEPPVPTEPPEPAEPTQSGPAAAA